MYPAPHDIDPEALKILDEAGFVWDSRLSGFRRSERAASEGVIEYEFLRAQKLIADSPLDGLSRRGQLLRLQILVRSID